jgi:hypothetical protein
MSGIARGSLIPVFLVLMLTPIAEAQNARTPLVAVAPSSIEAKEILKAQIAWIKANPQFSKVSVELSPLVIKKNDKYAYLVARASTSGPQPTEFTKDPFLAAILQREDGHWTSLGYVGGKPKNDGSISDMCGYGDGVGADVFKECGAKR